MKEAAVDSAGHPRRFSVVTTTPQLADSIVRRAGAYGLSAQCSGVQLTPEDPALLMADAERLVDALSEAGRRAVETDGAQALVIGGGPLAQAARALRPRFAVPVIEPIPAAVRLALKRAGIPARPD
jgi:Asp/Glu/hydantoin racemase